MTQANILIVDDERIINMDTVRRLEHLGYTVAGVADSGEEGVAQADKTRPDLVLMDIRMPGKMDGIAAAAQIQEQFSIPVVYVTAFGDEETLERAKVTDPFGYIIKPYNDRDLRVAIEIALIKSKLEQELRQTLRQITGLNTLLRRQIEEQTPMIEAVRDVTVKLHSIVQEASSLAKYTESLLSRGLGSASQKDTE